MQTRLLILIIFIGITSCAQEVNMKFNKLTKEEEQVIIHKGTEKPFSGKFYTHKDYGVYICKRCNAALYKSEDKFDSQCGWPSFDDEIDGAVKRISDADGKRTEIICASCGAHLGHVFEGEAFTDKNVRHCVNSLSLDFVPAKDSILIEKAIFASGCFWGTQFYFQKMEGVISTRVGYIGGHVEHPSYKQVCSGKTGHAEAIEVTYDPRLVSYEQLAKLFFETHDPTQMDGQGPDIGEQYRSAVFYLSDGQKNIAEKLVKILEAKGYNVVTEITKASTFWVAEDYHQGYYEQNGQMPYCHKYEKKFPDQ